MDALAVEQYGSRAGLVAIFQSLNMQLFLDVVCQTKLPAAICSNDAKSCYDHIVHGFAALAILQLGVPLTAIQVMFGTIQQLKHFIRTVYGDSIQSFSGTNHSKPIQGLGQGMGRDQQFGQWLVHQFWIQYVRRDLESHSNRVFPKLPWKLWVMDLSTT